MKWYFWLLIGFTLCSAIINAVLILIMYKKLGDEYRLSGKIKQKGRNTTNTISDITTEFKTPNKAQNRKRLINLKRKGKK